MKLMNINRQQDLVKFMHSIDKNDKEMKAEYWAACISTKLKDLHANN